MGRRDLIGHPDTIDGPTRARSGGLVRAAIEEWLADKTREEATDLLIEGGAPAGPVQTVEDLVRCPQLKARNMLSEVRDPIAGKRTMVRTPARLSRSPEVPTRVPPTLGEHTTEVLSEILGYGTEKILKLIEAGSV